MGTTEVVAEPLSTGLLEPPKPAYLPLRDCPALAPGSSYLTWWRAAVQGQLLTQREGRRIMVVRLDADLFAAKWSAGRRKIPGEAPALDG